MISISFNFVWVFKGCSKKIVAILMMSAKLATLDLLELKVTWNKGYDVIFFVHDVTNKILSRYSKNIVDVVIWPKFGNYHFYDRSYHYLNFTRTSPEKPIFLRGALGFKFNNLELALCMALRFYKSVVKRLKLKVRKFWGLIPTFVRVTAEKLVGGWIYSKLS